MKMCFRHCLSIVVLTLAPTFSRADASASSPLTAAVLPFSAQEPALEAQARSLATLTEAHLATLDSVQLVERAELDKVLGEQEATLSGAIDATTAARIGHLTGAKVLITGRCIPAGDRMIVVAKAMSTENGRLFAAKQTLGSADSPEKVSERLANELGKLIAEHRKELLPEVETAEQRLARLRKLLPAGGAALPAIHVSVTEEHLTRRVPDPAVQTEIQHTLQSLGFPIVEDPAKAAWSITGEAFSERGSQRGNLITCRARVELKTKRAGADKISVDRQIDVAMDLAENVAAKTALASAGAALADRLVALLVK